MMWKYQLNANKDATEKLTTPQVKWMWKWKRGEKNIQKNELNGQSKIETHPNTYQLQFTCIKN